MPSREVIKSAKEIQENILREGRIKARLEKLRYLIPHYAREGLSWEQVKLKHLVDDFPQKEQEELQELLFSNYQFSYWEVARFDWLKSTGSLSKLDGQNILVIEYDEEIMRLGGLLDKGLIQHKEGVGYFIPLTPSLFPVKDIDCCKQYKIIGNRDDVIWAFILQYGKKREAGYLYLPPDKEAELREKILFQGDMESEQISPVIASDGNTYWGIYLGEDNVLYAHFRYLVSMGINTRDELLEQGIPEEAIQRHNEYNIPKIAEGIYRFNNGHDISSSINIDETFRARRFLYRSRILAYIENYKRPVPEANFYRRVLLCPTREIEACLLRLLEENAIEYSHKKEDRYWGIKKPAKVKVGRSKASLKLFESLITPGEDL